MNIAILDFDYTLYDGFSRYNLGYKMEEEGVIGKGFKKELTELIRKHEDGEIDYNEKFAKDKAIFTKYYKDLAKLDVTRFLDNDFDLEAEMNSWARDAIKLLKDNGYLVVIVSGAWDFILEKAQEILDFDSFFGSQFELDSGKFTGDFVQIGDSDFKTSVTRSLLQGVSHSIGVGDSLADVPFLSLTDTALIYEPSKESAQAIDGKDITVVTRENILENLEALAVK